MSEISSQTVTVACPECDSKLKLKNRSMLGKVGKCPQCGHRFKLEAPEEVELELVETQARPLPGTSAHWVPDDTTAAASVPPPSEQTTVGNQPAFNFNLDTNSAPIVNATEGQSSSEATVTTARHTKRRRRNPMVGATVGAVLAAMIGGVAWGAYIYSQKAPVETVVKAQPVKNQDYEAEKRQLINNAKSIVDESPTSGEPIDLKLMPAGVRVVINLHPSKLWSNDPKYAEFRASMASMGDWLEAFIKTHCHFEPAQIEEAKIGVLIGARGSAPEFASVIRLIQPYKSSDMIAAFNGTPREDVDLRVYANDQFAFRLHDDRTIAFCPTAYVGDLGDFIDVPAMTSPAIQELLKETDRERLLSLVFEVSDLDQHYATSLPENLHQISTWFLDWVGPDVEAMAWSCHLDDPFYTELLVRNVSAVRPQKLQQQMVSKLDRLPNQLMEGIRKMTPSRSGYRKLIGRFPAMVKVVSLTTRSGIDARTVRLATELPSKAAPNLALAGILAWDESTRTNFDRIIAYAETPKLEAVSKPIKERLKIKIDVDFRRTPLQEAFAYISEEIKTEIVIDGDALKFAGYTKNMPQTFKMDEVPATEALHGILKQYEKMCLSLDEKSDRILVLTKDFAAKQNIKIYDVAPKKEKKEKDEEAAE